MSSVRGFFDFIFGNGKLGTWAYLELAIALLWIDVRRLHACRLEREREM